MHRGQRASRGNQTNHAIKAGYKGAADFFATLRNFFLLPGRHPYKHPMAPTPRTRKLAAYAAAVAVLLGVFSLYLRPDFLVTLAGQIWACF